jgi:ribonuclease HI
MAGQPYTGPYMVRQQIHRVTNVPKHVQLSVIEWAPQMEPWNILRENPGFEEAYQRYQQRMSLLPPKPTVDLATQRDVARQTGNLAPRMAHNPWEGCDDQISFRTLEVKPGMDIEPPGRYTVQLLQVTDAKGKKIPVFGCYNPDGQLLDTLDVDRVHRLHSQYQMYSGLAAVELGLTVGTFEEEIAKLLLRYKDSYRHQGKKLTSIKNHWANPPSVMNFCSKGLGTWQERFSSPLNSTFDTFFCLYEQDAVFGAYVNAFGYKYGGVMQSNTEYEPEIMDKDVHFSVMAAADSTKPYMAIHILPDWQMTAYKKYAGHMHLLTKIPRHMFKFKTPDHWKGVQTYAATPRWEVNLWLIYNNAGLEQYWNQSRVEVEAELLEQDLGGPLTWRWPRQRQDTHVKLTTAYKRLPDTPSRRPKLIPNHYQPREATSIRTFPGLHLYTDGSAIEGEDGRAYIGAGLYDATHDTSYHINPMGKGPTNTVPRAELAGLLGACQHACALQHIPNDTVHIFTDSLTSIHQLRRMYREAYQLRDHKHRDLLKAILDQITCLTRRNIQVRMWKVRGHIGIDGNEKADVAAGRAADMNKRRVVDGFHHSVSVGNEPYHDKVWIQHPHLERDGTRTWRYVTNLRNGLRAHITQDLQEGYTNNGVYATAWKNLQPHIHQPSMLHLWGNRVPSNTLRQNLKVRGGTLYNQKIAFREGRAPNSHCPLCHAEDSQTHILTQCSKLKDLHITRHNKITQIAMRAILAGEKGRFTVWNDAGKSCKEEMVGTISSHSIPQWLLPHQFRARAQELMHDDDERKYLPVYNPIPDWIFLEGLDAESITRLQPLLPTSMAPAMRNAQARATVHIVEVGCCMDTRIPTALVHKAAQHTALARTLEELGWKVQVHTVLCGVTGTIPVSTVDTLMTLGVKKPVATEVAKRMSRIAAACTHTLAIARRRRERDKVG